MEKDVTNNNIALRRYLKCLSQYKGSMIISNILFFVPTVLFIALFYGVSILLTKNVNIFILLMSVIPIMPFYSGLCHIIVRAITNKKITPLKDYLFGIKDNLKNSLINGVVFYIVSVLIYTAINMYYGMAMEYGGFFSVFLIMNIIIAVAALFFFLSVFVMTVSLELSAKVIYKNSILAIFGELKNNLFSLAGFIVLISILSLIVFMPINIYVNIIITVLLFMLVIPSFTTLIYFNLLYHSIVSAVGIKPIEKPTEQISNEEQELLEKKLNDSNNDDEYIYYNGKMIKRGKLREILEKENN